jgi:PST family polysaccharide transporter
MIKNANQSTLKKLGDNFASLVVLQGINYLVPLIVFPYLVRVLGIDVFGVYSFVLAIIMYGVMLSDYGFDLSATRLISLHSHNKTKTDEIFSTVMVIKFGIAFLYLLVLTLLILFVDKLSQNASLYFIAYGLVIGQVLFPVWFYQGIEKMRYITILNALAKIIFTVLILIYVHTPDDLYLVLLFNSLGAIVAGIIALYMAVKKFNISFYLPSVKQIKFYLEDGWYIFTSRIAVELYVTANVIILGFFASDAIVGYYSIVEKIVRAIGSLLEPLTRTVFPYLAKVYEQSHELFFKRNKQLFFLILSVMLPTALLVFFNASWILGIVSGQTATPLMITLLQIFSFILVFFLYGHQFTNMLVTLGETKLLNNIVMIAGIINIISAPIVIYLFGVVGLVYLNVSIALFIASTKGYYIFYHPKVVNLSKEK